MVACSSSMAFWRARFRPGSEPARSARSSGLRRIIVFAAGRIKVAHWRIVYSILPEARGLIKDKILVSPLLAGNGIIFQPMGQLATVLLFAFMSGADNFQ